MFRFLFLFAALAKIASAGPGPLKIVVHKAERTLEVFHGDSRSHRFTIGLGLNPLGTKEKSGDGRTPEGHYRICVKNARSRFYLSLGISYPSAVDAARGLKEGLVSQAEHDRIVLADQKKTIPPWNTALGGEIFIHGEGASSDWTLGCLALENSDMKTLFDLIPVGTAVEIRP